MRYGLLFEDLPQQPARLGEIEAAFDAVLALLEPGIHQGVELAVRAGYTDGAQGTVTGRRFPEIFEATDHRRGPLANDPPNHAIGPARSFPQTHSRPCQLPAVFAGSKPTPMDYSARGRCVSQKLWDFRMARSATDCDRQSSLDS